MKSTRIITIGLVAAAGVALAATMAVAHPGGGWGPGAGPGAGRGMGMGPGMGPWMTAQGSGPLAGLFTPEVQATFQERMRNAATLEERQQIAQERRTEMQRRAAERGITLPGLPGK